MIGPASNLNIYLICFLILNIVLILSSLLIFKYNLFEKIKVKRLNQKFKKMFRAFTKLGNK